MALFALDRVLGGENRDNAVFLFLGPVAFLWPDGSLFHENVFFGDCGGPEVLGTVFLPLLTSYGPKARGR